ncbi:hypothetical protein HanLR1_Chr12g0435801 [Helianthus annuus]|nr:hypothetical protein HanLR1_Chr12g0435801 [Helianthus annuus]
MLYELHLSYSIIVVLLVYQKKKKKKKKSAKNFKTDTLTCITRWCTYNGVRGIILFAHDPRYAGS